jgi:hypothetical protein
LIVGAEDDAAVRSGAAFADVDVVAQVLDPAAAACDGRSERSSDGGVDESATHEDIMFRQAVTRTIFAVR